MKHIWLIGGTQESAQLAIALTQARLPCIVTVTTTTARSLYPTAPTLQVAVGRLRTDQISEFIQHHKICAILDASHPFAVEISELAIATASQLQLPYLRYERPTLTDANSSALLYVDSFETLLAGDLLQEQRVLLTVGYRPLALFQSWQNQVQLFARILPSITALDAALEAGFTPDRLIALRPPITADLERALWQHWQISLVVTKESGTAGGEDVKRQVATELGVKLVAIARPPITYPQQTSDVQTAVAFCISSFHSQG